MGALDAVKRVILKRVGLIDHVDVGEAVGPGEADIGLGPLHAQPIGDQVGPGLQGLSDQLRRRSPVAKPARGVGRVPGATRTAPRGRSKSRPARAGSRQGQPGPTGLELSLANLVAEVVDRVACGLDLFLVSWPRRSRIASALPPLLGLPEDLRHALGVGVAEARGSRGPRAR